MLNSQSNLRRLLAVLFISLGPAGAMTPGRPSVDYVRTIPSVREFTKPRSFLTRLANWIAGPPEGKPEVVRPYATTHDSTGRLMVADPGQQGIHIYDFEKRKYQFVRGPRGRALVSPIGVACDTNDNIYVTDSIRAQVYVFDVNGRFLRSIGGATGESRLLRPTGLYLDRSSRRLYLTDTLRHQILVFGLDGTLQRVIGKRGAGPGEFNFPTALTMSAGRLQVVDSMNFRIQTLTPDGQFVSAFGQLGTRTGTLNRPKGVAADTEGNLYVVDALFETVQVFNPAGQLLYYFGSSGVRPGQFQLPTGISIDERNVIYIADSQNHRVQVFRFRRTAE